MYEVAADAVGDHDGDGGGDDDDDADVVGTKCV